MAALLPFSIFLLALTAVGCAQSAGSAETRAGASSGTMSDYGFIQGNQPVGGAPLPSVMRTFRVMPEQSEAFYEVQERLFMLPAPSKAVGRTTTMEGEFQLILGPEPRLEGNRFRVDLRTLTSDSARRDRFIREQWLESNLYPFADFTATQAQDLPQRYVEGEEVPFKLTGDMTIRDVTRPLTFDTRAALTANTLAGTATTFLLMRDFGFDPPEILGAVRVDDGVTLTFRFMAEAIEG